MSSDPYYGPIGESPEEIFLEKTFLAGGYLTGVGYGVQLVLYIACLKILWRRRDRGRFTYFLIVYISLLCSMNTIWTATTGLGLQLTFIDNRNYPGGVIGFLNVEYRWPSNVAATSSYIVSNALADLLLLWRCRVIWSASLLANADYLMIFPTLLLVASLAMGIVFDISTASPDGLYGPRTATIATAYFSLSLSLNILLTFMIAGRIWSYQRRVTAAIGDEFGGYYTSITTMFVESAAIYAVVSILLLATFAARHPINGIWIGICPSVQLITSYLIIYRVADGRAWRADTMAITNATNVTFTVCRQSALTETSTDIGGGNDIALHGVKEKNHGGVINAHSEINNSV